MIYPGIGHIKILAGVSSRLPGHADLMAQIAEFINEVTIVEDPPKDLTAK
ncbi:MAG: hypothetical protein ACRETM_14105 [Stenotrophobium sp.]